jgi:TP901 family phage tail tape measure protein
MSDEYSISANIELDTSGFTSGIESAQDAIKDFQDGISGIGDNIEEQEKKGAGGLKDWGLDVEKFTSKGSSMFKSFGLDVDKLASKFGMSGPLMAGIVAVTAALAKLGQEMDEVTSTIAKGTGAIGDELFELDHNAKKALVDGVGVSVQETGQLIADLNTRLGFSGRELEEATVQFGHFAKVTGTDVKSAVNDVADVMKRWNVPANKSKDLMNQLAKASQLSGASVTELMSSVKSGQTYLQQFGFNLSESVALLSSFKQNGIQTETVMTGMRTALAKFSAEGKNAKEAFAEVSKQIKEAGNETEAMQIAVETFGNRAGPEMFKTIRDGSADFEKFTEEIRNAGTALDDTFEASRTSKDAMNDLKNALKGTFGDLGQSVTAVFKNIVDSITELVRFIEPVITPILRVVRTVVTKIAELVSYVVKEIRRSIEENSVAWQAWVKVLNDVGKSLESIFGDIIGIFKDTFGLIFSLIGGRWEEAWVHAQLIFFRFARVIANVCNTIANLFGDLVNFIAKKVVGKFGESFKNIYKNYINFSKRIGINFTGLDDEVWNLDEKKLSKVIDKVFEDFAEGKALDKVDLAESWGLNAKIDELEARLKELKGVTSEISDLGASLDFGGSSLALPGFDESGMGKMEQESKVWLQKRLEQQLDNITKEKEAKLQALREEGASQEQLDKINQLYAENQIALYEQIQAMKMESDLESISGLKNYEEEKLSLEEYYADEAEKYRINAMTNSVKAMESIEDESARKRAEMEAMWLNKLDQQRNDSLAFQEKALKELAQTELEKEEVAWEYTQKKYELEKERIEMARQQALQEIGDVQELIKLVNEYYDTQRELADGNQKVEQMQHEQKMENLKTEEDEEKKKAEKIKKYIKEIVKMVSSKVVNAFKKVFSEIGKAVKKIAGLVKSAFVTLIDFDNDKMLDSLLQWEDKVLTFFTEGIHQIPAFVKSVLQSVKVLTDNVMGLINSDEIKAGLTDIVQTVISELPAIIDNIANIISTLMEIVIDGIGDNMDGIVNAIVAVIKKIVKLLPKIIPKLIGGIVMLIEGLIDAIVQLLDDEETMDSIVDAIASGIQKIFESSIKYLPKIIKAIIKIIWYLIKAIVKGIISCIKDTDWKGIWNAIKNWFGNIWDAIKNWFKDIWGKVKNWFENIGNHLKSFFQGIADWFKGIWESISGWFASIGQFFSDFWQGFKDMLTKIGNWFKDVGSAIGGYFSNIGKGVKEEGFIGFWKGLFGHKYAEGTDNAEAGVALVGEEGPELVRFRGGEQVLNNRDTMGLLSSPARNGSVFNVTFNNTVDTTAFTMMKQMKGWQRSLAFNAVI